MVIPAAKRLHQALCNPSPEAKMIMQVHVKLHQNNNKKLYDEVTKIGSVFCANTSIKEAKCHNSLCCENAYPDDCNDAVRHDAFKKRVEIFKDIKFKDCFLYTLKDSIEKLQTKEQEVRLLLAEDKISHQEYKKIVQLITHKKDCCYEQYTLFEEMENEVTVPLLTQLRAIVDEEKKQRDKEFCQKIKTITIMKKKGDGRQIQHNNYKQYRNNYTQCSIDDDRRDENRSLDGFGHMLGTAVAVKMMYDAVNRNYESINDVSSSYSDSNSCSDNNDSSGD